MEVCPVCKTEVEKNKNYCLECAWEFEYYFDELGEEEKNLFLERIKIAKYVYAKSINIDKTKKLENELKELQNKTKEIENSKDKIIELETKYHNSIQTKRNLETKLVNYKTIEDKYYILKEETKELKEKENNATLLKKELSDSKNKIVKLEEKEFYLKVELDEIKASNRYFLKLKKIKWSTTPVHLTLLDYEYHFTEFSQDFNIIDYNKNKNKIWKNIFYLLGLLGIGAISYLIFLKSNKVKEENIIVMSLNKSQTTSLEILEESITKEMKKDTWNEDINRLISKKIIEPIKQVETPKMVYIKKGSYIMGSNNTSNSDEKPEHKINIKDDFMIGKYEITYREFFTFYNDSDIPFEDKLKWFYLKSSKDKEIAKLYIQSIALLNNNYYDDYPIVQVNWFGAKAYTEWLTKKTGEIYRLPSESEWEYVARAGTKTKWYFGRTADKIKDFAWYSQNSSLKTHRVGTKKPNIWGVYNMYGNVYEWCDDKYDRNYKYTPRDNSSNPNDKNKRVIRGGSYSNGAYETRPSSRSSGNPSYGDHDIGFRVVKEISLINAEDI